MTRDLFDIMSGDDDRKPRNGGVSAETIDLEMVLHYDTGKAVHVSDNGEESAAVSLPRSQIEVSGEGKTVSSVKKDGQRIVLPVVTVSIPEWLARDKGLV